MKKPQMIIFDYGGTILFEPDFNFLNGEREVFKHVVKNPLKVTPEQINDFNERIYSESDAARMVEFELHHNQMLHMKYEYNLVELDIPLEEAEWILWQGVSPVSEKCCMPGIKNALDYINQNGIRSGVISNMGWSGNNLSKRINAILPENKFEFIIASSEYGYRKPNPLLFQLAAKKAGLNPEDIWFCGDTFSADVEGAHNVGMFPIYYQGVVEGGPKRHPLEKNPDFDFVQINHWNELVELLKKCD